jgi:hypothetical protein
MKIKTPTIPTNEQHLLPAAFVRRMRILFSTTPLSRAARSLPSLAPIFHGRLLPNSPPQRSRCTAPESRALYQDQSFIALDLSPKHLSSRWATTNMDLEVGANEDRRRMSQPQSRLPQLVGGHR